MSRLDELTARARRIVGAPAAALSLARMEFRMLDRDTVVTNRVLARVQYFVKATPRDFVGERLSGTGGLPG